MSKFLVSFAFLLVLLPAAAMADKRPANADKIESLIEDRAFLDETRIDEMREETKGLSVEWKQFYYNQYSRSVRRVYLNFAVPSLGSWIIGDPLGAVVSLVGSVAGYAVFLNYYSVSSMIGLSDYSSWVMLGGLALVVASDFISVITGMISVGGYNNQLANGLSINPWDEGNSGYLMPPADSRLAADGNRPADLFHIDLLSFQF